MLNKTTLLAVLTAITYNGNVTVGTECYWLVTAYWQYVMFIKQKIG